jgi:hypothetical protein
MKHPLNKLIIMQMTFLIKSSMFCLMIGLAVLKPALSQTREKNNFEDWSKKPAIVSPVIGTTASSDAIVLFSKDELNQWESLRKKGTPAQWKINGDFFTVEPGTGDIVTKQSFGDCQLHMEWKTPENEVQSSLNYGNSGIYLMGLYEVQIYSSYKDEHEIYYNGQAGSIYKQHRPLVNACLPSGTWQTYDIVFTAPRFRSDLSLESPAYITVFHNGVLIQYHFQLTGPTSHTDFTEYRAHAEKLPVLLQEHHSKVSYRNIWIREL